MLVPSLQFFRHFIGAKLPTRRTPLYNGQLEPVTANLLPQKTIIFLNFTIKLKYLGSLFTQEKLFVLKVCNCVSDNQIQMPTEVMVL